MDVFSNGTGNLGIGSAISGLSNAAAAAFGLNSGNASIANTPLVTPWDPQAGANYLSAFYPPIALDASRWNQLFPYRLVVIDVTNNNSIVSGFGDYKGTVTGVQQGTPTLTFNALTTTKWEFNLPITPQQLSITDQYAINTSATLRGVLEEHNGIKFKLINASGSMGVWPYRESVSKPPGSPSILQSVFGGTLTAITGLINQVATTVNTFTTNNPNQKPNTIGPTSAGATFGPTSTGYYQALYLQQFIEQYAEAKKNPDNAGWRLVFDIPKQNTSYVVTPMQYVWQQSAQKPMEIMYQLQFKAWRRITLSESSKVVPANVYKITPGILQRILNGITEARLTCSSAIAVIGAVTSDVNGVFNVLSQTALFVKDLMGVGTAASDLPASIQKDFSSAIQNYASINSNAIATAVTTTAGVAAVAAIAAAQTARNGISQTAASNGQLGNSVANAQQTNPAANIFNNPNAFVDLMDQVPTSQLVLNTAQQNKLNNILNNTTLTVQQLKNNANSILSLAVQLEGYFGAGAPLYNELYNLTPPPVRNQPMSIPQFLILDTLYEFIQSVNILTATTQITDLNIQSSLDYVAGLATQSGIPFDVPTSKIIVPVPFNTTIEGIAARYLGDPNRWLEIATLNSLEEPYLDYLGFQLPLVTNAIGRQAVVTSNVDLYLGQTVTFMAAGQIQQSRSITNITPLPNNGGYLITLDGEPNLGNFTTANKAYIQAYLPNTVNAMQKIYIPSDLPVAQLQGQVNIPLPPLVSLSGDPLADISGVDWLLDDNGDIIIDQYGNFLLSYGMTNIVQALRILFTTTINSFMLEPQYGLGVIPGTSVADLNIQDLAKQINMQIQADPRFDGVTGLQIAATPPTLTISVGVQIAGQTGVFPVNFELAA